MDEKVRVEDVDLRVEAQEIKERLTTVETLLSYVHRDQLAIIAREAIDTDPKRRIVKQCVEPQTIDELQTELGYNSAPALRHHLNPLREGHVVLEETKKDGRMAFVQSRLLKKLPKKVLDSILRI